MTFNRNKSLSKAQKLLQKGKIPDAIAEFLIIVENDPADVRTLLRIGDLYAKVGNVESACDTYHKVAEHYAKEGFFLKAVAVFKQILKLDPGLIRVYLRLAELYQQLGLNSEAMKQYQVVVKHYENQGLKKESLDVLKKMAELDPENTASRVKLAELYSREGHNEAAFEQFRTVSNDLSKKNNFQDLARVYEKMETLSIADDAIRIELSEVYLKIAEPKRALAKLQDLFKANPKHPQVLELLARTFLDLQQPEKAKSVYMELVGVLDTKGMPLDKDRILAKLRAMGVTSVEPPIIEAALDEAPLVLEPIDTTPPPIASAPVTTEPKVMSPPLATPKEPPAGASTESTVSTGPKLLQEVEIFLKYGLVEKACQMLSQAVIAEPQSEAYRTKLIEAYQQKNDPDGLIGVLTRASVAAKKLGNSDVVAALMAEIDSLNPPSGAHATQTPPALIPTPETVHSVEEIPFEIVDDEPAAPEAVIAEPQAKPPAAPTASESEIDFGQEFERVESSEDNSLEIDLSDVELDQSLTMEMATEAKEPDANSENVDLDASIEMHEDMPSIGEREPLVEATTFEPLLTPDVEEAEEVEVPAEAEAETDLSAEADSSEPEIPGSAWVAEMEEADFFVSQGLLEEAIDVYETVLGQDPSFKPAQEKLKELKGSSAPKMRRPEPIAPPKPPTRDQVEIEPSQPVSKRTERVLREEKAQQESKQPKAESTELFFDLSSELQDEIHEIEEEFERKPKPEDEDEEEYLSPEEVISEFKKGVSRTVAKDDYATHYNLGIAYKEMGLLNEAIHEFEVASEDPKMAMDGASMIGLCLIGKKDYEAAIDVYRKALALTSPTSAEALGLSYELAEAYIGHGNLGEAYKFFARVRDVDPNFRDVRRRAKELEADLGNAAPPASAVEKKKPDDEQVVKNTNKKNKISYI